MAFSVRIIGYSKTEDEAGNRYDYRREGFTQDRPEPPAEEWLGVHPEPEF